jgi:hypothetical protein
MAELLNDCAAKLLLSLAGFVKATCEMWGPRADTSLAGYSYYVYCVIIFLSFLHLSFEFLFDPLHLSRVLPYC